MTEMFAPLTFAHGAPLPNRLMLAPLTNQQSHADGTLSQAELHWLTMRAKGGFGGVMTAAAYVTTEGKGFPGQLGIHDDICLPGLTQLAAAINAAGSRSAVQLHHAGIRADQKASGLQAVGPSDDAATGARAMNIAEVEATIEAYIAAAERAHRAGFNGVELHGAHNYLLCEFLSLTHNHRDDLYGGSLENRARPLRKIIHGIRARCGAGFTLGVRLTVERFGIEIHEARALCGELMAEKELDYLDLSLWDVFKEPEAAAFKGRSLIDWFAELPRHATRLGVAGQIRSGGEAQRSLDAGADFVLIGRAGIANHDFPQRLARDADYQMPKLPLSRAHLAQEGVSPVFLDYLQNFPNFMEPV